MHLPQDAMLLRIFIGESDRWHHQPLYEAIVLKARELHLAGATVLRGPMGFGKSSRLHTAKILRLSMDLPVVIEIIGQLNALKCNTLLAPAVADLPLAPGVINQDVAHALGRRAEEVSPILPVLFASARQP